MLRFTFLALISLFAGALLGQDADRVLGVWINADSSQVIQVERRGEVYEGKLIELKGESNKLLLDIENPDLEKRNRNLVGADIWLQFVYDVDKDYWREGKIYNFKNGNTYNGKIRVVGDELILTGHYGFFFFLSKNQEWLRVK